ncbi:MAG: NUDIX domain-containing protein [Tenericutes bacterium]|jgi:8-oxo-dGTP pyrophosphatase MutT (NUDIX family)|nr:NUDIX domain-containing protein [Mycoplasmatota bacterium]
MEYFDLYDKKGLKLNKTMPRGTSNLPGEYHRVVHIWIMNSKNEYLIQQRNKSTDTYPYQWAPTAGAVQAGEVSLQAAIRETKEEIGLVLKESELKLIDSFYIDDSYANYIIDMYLAKNEVNLESLTIEKKEVKAVKLATKNVIIELLEQNQFWNYHELNTDLDYFELLEKRQQ